MRMAHGTSSPSAASIQVHPGELATVMYEFRNVQNRTMAAQAIPSYAPKQATAHFNKLECFCFARIHAGSGRSQAWPVVFVIDPKLPKDVTTITLSYTFFEVGGKVPPAAPRAAPRRSLRGRRGSARGPNGPPGRSQALAPGGRPVWPRGP